MTDLVGRPLDRLAARLPGRVSTPGDDDYAAATAIWSKPVGRMPRAVVHCRTAEDVRSAIRAARECGLSLSVRGGGHDWAGRALCDGVVIDLSGMRSVAVASDETATVAGGARTVDVLAATDPLGLAPVTGTCSTVGVAGLTLGGGYGPLIGRFGLALDNLEAAEVVLADGRVVLADHENEEELFWALRGGGGNFGVVTAMRIKLHRLPSVRSGMLIYPFSEAKAVLERSADIANSAPDELTVQVGVVHGPTGSPVVLINPTWSGEPEAAEARTAPFSKLGALLMGANETSSYRQSLTVFDPFIVNGRRNFMDSSWIDVTIALKIEALFLAKLQACGKLIMQRRIVRRNRDGKIKPGRRQRFLEIWERGRGGVIGFCADTGRQFAAGHERKIQFSIANAVPTVADGLRVQTNPHRRRAAHLEGGKAGLPVLVDDVLQFKVR